MVKVRVIMLIPKKFDDGQLVPTWIFREFEDKLLELVGGFAEDWRPCGAMVDNNELYKHHTKKYIVVTDEKQIKELKEIVIKVGKQLKQKVMYFESVPESTVEYLEVK